MNYYHSVKVILIAIADDIWDEDFEEIWDLSQLTDWEPVAICLYKETREELNELDFYYDPDDEECYTSLKEEDVDYIIEAYEDCTIAVNDDYEITWFSNEEDY